MFPPAVHPPVCLKEVTIYTDGAAKGNPGRGGFGTLLVYRGQEKEISAGFERTTNNRMELLAAIAGLETLNAACRVALHSDSRYLVDAMNKGWLKGWKSRGWARANQQHLKNRDLWQRLDAAAAPHRIEWRWVRGHAGHAENERCDQLADAATRSPRLEVDSGFLEEEARNGAQGDLI